MTARTRVAIYGNSAVMAGVEAVLGRHAGIEILTDWIGPGDCVPDVILFDVNAPQAEMAIALLRRHPGVRLIGLDVGRATAITYAERLDQVVTMDDLAGVITGETDGS